MSLKCSITGEVCVEPVVTRTGDVYEKGIIVKHIKATGLDPNTKEPLSEEDLIPIKFDNSDSVKPRLSTGTSMSGILQMLQTEWDSIMLETYNIKKQLETSRRELSHALYQHDAACRVIARLIKERDQAREELERWKVEALSSTGKPDFQFRALTDDVKLNIDNKYKELTQARTNRVTSKSLSTKDEVVEYNCSNTFPIHKTTSPGILSIDIHPTKPDLIVTGGVDKTSVVYNIGTSKKVATLSGHEKQVNIAIFHPDEVVFTGSDDSTVKVWNPSDSGYECSHTFIEHKAPIVDICLHPTNNYVLTVSKDSSWGFYDFEKGNLLTQVMNPDRSPFTCAHFHPDGYIFATGTQNNAIRIFDIRSQKAMATFQGHLGPIVDVCFSENGYYFASCSEDNSVKVWDLRGNTPTNISTISLELTPTALHYDNSGLYLGVAAGHEIRIFTLENRDNVRELQHLKTLDDHTDTVTDFKFGPNSKFLISSSLDKNVKIWGK